VKYAYQFFLRHAGYCFDPKTETEIQGRRRCAKALAEAERRGTELGLSIEWEDDRDADTSFLDQKDLFDDDDRANARFHRAIVRDADGTVRAVLGGIHENVALDGFRETMRVVRAELFSEALAALDRQKESAT
jgi:hypothetical protein